VLTEAIQRAAREFGDRAAFVTPAGKTLSFEQLVQAAQQVSAGLHERGLGEGSVVGLVLPSDIVTADRFDEDASSTAVGVNSIEEGTWGLDIGPATAEQFAEVIGGSGSVFWNGPMGVFEWEAFQAGTATVAAAMARSSGFRVAGGGDSVAALRMLGRQDDLDHLSTGGGAGLELLEGRTLPGVKGLERWAR